MDPRLHIASVHASLQLQAIVVPTVTFCPGLVWLNIVQGTAGMARIAPLAAFLFLAFVYRELLMDATDVDGDASLGIMTLPVVLGSGPALMLGMTLLCLAAWQAASLACFGPGLALEVRWLGHIAGIAQPLTWPS